MYVYMYIYIYMPRKIINSYSSFHARRAKFDKIRDDLWTASVGKRLPWWLRLSLNSWGFNPPCLSKKNMFIVYLYAHVYIYTYIRIYIYTCGPYIHRFFGSCIATLACSIRKAMQSMQESLHHSPVGLPLYVRYSHMFTI